MDLERLGLLVTFAAALLACGEDDSDCADLLLSGTPSDEGPDAAQDVGVPPCATDLEGELDRLRVPGVAAGLLVDGALSCVSAAGMASLETDRAVRPGTGFLWASVSKSVTATALLILYDEGRFELDDPVAAHLPFAIDNPACADTPITFRHLLTHTSSIRDSDIVDDHYVAGDSPVSLAEFYDGYLTPGGAFWHESNFAGTCPGDAIDYSNAGAALLGLLVQTIADTPFDAFCRERLFAPLGMNDTSFRLADLRTGMLARPYDGGPGELEPLVHYGFPTYPDGTLRATIPDLARFLGMMAGGGELEGVRILEASTVTEAAALQVPDLDDTQGLIWFYDHGDRLGHDGGDCGASSFMFYDPATGDGALLVANGDWHEDTEDDDSPEADALFARLLEEAAQR